MLLQWANSIGVSWYDKILCVGKIALSLLMMFVRLVVLIIPIAFLVPRRGDWVAVIGRHDGPFFWTMLSISFYRLVLRHLS